MRFVRPSIPSSRWSGFGWDKSLKIRQNGLGDGSKLGRRVVSATGQDYIWAGTFFLAACGARYMRSEETISTSLSLLNHARQREHAAWKELVRIYGPLVLEWCRQHGVRNADAEDIVQEVFLTVANHLDRFGEKSGKHNFRGWLWTIVRSKVLDHLRRQKRIPFPVNDSLCVSLMNDSDWGREERSSEDVNQDFAVLVSRSLVLIQNDFSEQTWSAFWRIPGVPMSMSCAIIWPGKGIQTDGLRWITIC